MPLLCEADPRRHFDEQDAEHAKRFVALAMNINAAKGLQEVLKTNRERTRPVLLT
jgi:hypothetical protein